MDLTTCSYCHMQVTPEADGTCPRCGAPIPPEEKASPPTVPEVPKTLPAAPPVASFYDMSAALKRDLRGVGIILIVWGLIPFLFPQVFSRVWGGFFILLGIVNLLVRNRVLFILSSLAFMAVGAWNILNFLLALSAGYGVSVLFRTFWIIIGILQIIWGVQMLGKYKEYAPNRNS
jgi:hypothetical protein